LTHSDEKQKRTNFRQRVEDLLHFFYYRDGKFNESFQFSIYDDMQDWEPFEYFCETLNISYENIQQYIWRGSELWREHKDYLPRDNYYFVPIEEFIDWCIKQPGVKF